MRTLAAFAIFLLQLGTAQAYGKPLTFTSKVSFSVPGPYVLQAIASDGQLTSTHKVTVTVNPAR